MARIARIEGAIRKSLEFAWAKPDQCLPYIRSYAQEIEEEVVKNHINLYVNDFSRDLGIDGLAAVKEFLDRGRAVGILPASDLPLLMDEKP